MISGDTRLEELGISERLQQECNAVVWEPAKGAENIAGRAGLRVLGGRIC